MNIAAADSFFAIFGLRREDTVPNQEYAFDESLIVHFAFRYALGRMSVAPGIVTKYIRERMDRLPVDMLEAISNEIDEAPSLGMKGIDDVTWWGLQEDIENYIAGAGSEVAP